jgi:TolB-like protein
MKKAVVFSILALLPVIVFSQNALTIDVALNNSTSYFSNILPANTKVVVLNCTSKWPDLSDYIIEELIGYIVNERKLTVVDRQNLENIRKEMNFQLSGDVSDETAQSIGKMLGAQTIISGSITAIGNAYRLRIRAISVETAQILGMQNVDVVQDSRIAALTGTAYTGPAVATPASPAPRAEATDNTPQTAATITTVNTSPTNTRFIELSKVAWKSNFDPKSSIRFTVNKENIEGWEREVLQIIGTLGNNSGRFAEVSANTPISQIITGKSGMRFKVLGDGKKWDLRIWTQEAMSDSAWYYSAISTRRDRIDSIDIPFNRLRQPANWGKKVSFNKNGIFNMSFAINYETQGTISTSIKIFDLEIY